VARYQFCSTATQPLIRLSSQLTSLLRPSILTITNDSWQHRHHTAMREQGGGNNESRKFGVSHKETCLSLVCAADFSIQAVSEEFVGKVRS
jgi:stress-induced morphogen